MVVVVVGGGRCVIGRIGYPHGQDTEGRAGQQPATKPSARSRTSDVLRPVVALRVVIQNDHVAKTCLEREDVQAHKTSLSCLAGTSRVAVAQRVEQVDQ